MRTTQSCEPGPAWPSLAASRRGCSNPLWLPHCRCHICNQFNESFLHACHVLPFPVSSSPVAAFFTLATVCLLRLLPKYMTCDSTCNASLYAVCCVFPETSYGRCHQGQWGFGGSWCWSGAACKPLPVAATAAAAALRPRPRPQLPPKPLPLPWGCSPGGAPPLPLPPSPPWQ
jgi:hypothetical protein